MFDFSVITVCKNSELDIARCIRSINEQQGITLEHIIIDGASTDKTTEIISKISQKKFILVSEKDNGLYYAMNKGLLLCRGKYIAILNSDDVFSSRYSLSKVKTIFETENSDVVFSSVQYITKDHTKKFTWIPQDFKYGDYRYGWHAPHPGFFVNKFIYERLGLFDTSFNVASDFELMLRFMENRATKSSKLDDVTVLMQSGGYSSYFKNRVLSIWEIYNAFKKNNIKPKIFFIIFNRYIRKIMKIFI